jgi:lysophospholipase L1-like esterase
MKKLPLALTAVAGASLLLVAGCAAVRIDAGRKLARASTPYSAAPANATATMLVVGDSTGVGTGAKDPANSVAGRLSAVLPRLAIENRSENGAHATDVLRQLGASPATHYDVILVQVGGNDVIGFTREDELRASMNAIARIATRRARLVILLPAGNVGNAPFFFVPLSWVMTARSRTLHAIVKETAQQSGAVYVNLFQEKADDPFVQDPERLYAVDGLHPSDDGYALWEAQLLAQSGLVAFLQR